MPRDAKYKDHNMIQKLEVQGSYIDLYLCCY